MNTPQNSSRITLGVILLLATALILGLMVVRPALSVGGTPEPHEPDRPQGRRGFLGMPNGGTITVQRLWSDTAGITVTYALSNGTPVKTTIGTIDAESLQIYTPTQGFTGLGLVTVDQPGSDPGPAFGVNTLLSTTVGNDAYLGLEWEDLASSQQSPTPFTDYLLYLPRVAKGDGEGWSSTFTLQNRNMAITAIVVLTFYSQFGMSTISESAAIPAGGAVTYNLNDVPGLALGFYSVVISSDQPVAVASVREFNATLGLSDSYQGADTSTASSVLFAPALFKESDLQTSILCVQNADSMTANVNVTYTDGITSTKPIPAFATFCFEQAAEAHASGWAGEATITSMAKLVAVAIVTADNGGSPVGRWSYTVPSQVILNPAVAFPLLNSRH
jgi:hypothetical protein